MKKISLVFSPKSLLRKFSVNKYQTLSGIVPYSEDNNIVLSIQKFANELLTQENRHKFKHFEDTAREFAKLIIKNRIKIPLENLPDKIYKN